MIISPLLKLAVEQNASDMFITVGAPIYLKVNGVMQPVNAQKIDPEAVKRIAYELMTPEQIATFEATMELNFSFRDPLTGNFRVNVFRQRNNIAVVIRYIRAKIPNVEELNLPLILNQLVMEKRGLILVVGATGSGKSTTLAAMLEFRNITQPGHILTIEDPVEYLFRHNKSIINQREVGGDTLSYGNALLNAMREAPDVLMIGEIRDRETLKHALIFSQSGHLCLSTMHANNTYHALNRIVNFFPNDERQAVLSDLSLSLRAVISQRLVPSVQEKLLPAVEVLLNTTLISNLIKNDEIEKIREAIEKSMSPGSQTFEQALVKLFKSGKISKDTALLYADSASNISSLIDYSQTTKMKSFSQQPAASEPGEGAADFSSIKLDIDDAADKR